MGVPNSRGQFLAGLKKNYLILPLAAYLLCMSDQSSDLRRLGEVGSMESGLNTVVEGNLRPEKRKQKSVKRGTLALKKTRSDTESASSGDDGWR